MYVVLARKHRPRRFEEVVGQEHIATTLQNAVRNGRVAHAYLFCGSRGVGKTTMARILASALNCEEGPTPAPCGECEACRRIRTGDFIDVIEIDGASNRGIDEVRELRQNAGFMPSHSRYKVYYIDEVHMLTVPAFNALLKTLEEPPPHVKFIFSTTDPQQLPDTVKSRCQRFDFRRLSDAQITDHLEDICGRENIELEESALATIAHAARGSMRDALSALDQVSALSEAGEKVGRAEVLHVLGAVERETLSNIVEALGREKTAEALKEVHALLFSGTDVVDLADQLSEYLRDLMVAHYCAADSEVLSTAMANAETLNAQRELFTSEQLLYMIQLLREAKLRARRDTTGRLALELAVIKMSRFSALVDLEEALETLPAGDQQDTPGTAEKKTNNKTRQSNRSTGKATARLRRIKNTLKHNHQGSNGDNGTRAEPAAPEGISTAKFRQMRKVAEDCEAARALLRDKPLLEAFSAADSTLGLHPVRVAHRRDRPDQEQEETEQTNRKNQNEDTHSE